MTTATISHLSLEAATAATIFTQFKQTPPLVHCLTNEVVQSFTANVLLALGASPAMVVEASEASQFAGVANAVLVNLGTLYPEREKAMLAAIAAANAADRPWVLDPVAVGGLSYRTEFAHALLCLKPAAIRGNASEIMALSGMTAGGRGVDSTADSAAAMPAAQALAQQSGAIVAVTGLVDFITDGVAVIAVPGGAELMTRVVGTGCALSAVVAAFCGLPLPQSMRLQQVALACQVMADCGAQATAAAAGPGSFVSLFVDALYHYHPAAVCAGVPEINL
ncbi:MAG: hydroxyethylthiazole kinase [Neisseriaceae bacterium]|nr:hydroxyethylthiazole kinase [Neisseriaceae bacterium]